MNMTQDVHRESFRIAGFWTRLWAYLIDLIVVSALSTPVILVLARMISPEEGFRATGILIRIAGAGIGFLGITGFLYFSLMTYYFGQTLGKMIQGIRVIRLDGKNPDLLTVLIREVVGRTISQLNGLHLGYIWARFHPTGFAWHDLLSDTLVVWEKEMDKSQWYTVEKKEQEMAAENINDEQI